MVSSTRPFCQTWELWSRGVRTETTSPREYSRRTPHLPTPYPTHCCSLPGTVARCTLVRADTADRRLICPPRLISLS